MKRIWILLVAMICAASAQSSDTLPVLYSSLGLESGLPKVGDTFTLRFKGITFRDLPSVTVGVAIPNGVVCLDESTKFSYSLSAGDSVQFDMRLVICGDGPHLFRAHTATGDSDVSNFLCHTVTDFYVLSQNDTADWSSSPLADIDGYNLTPDEVIQAGDGDEDSYHEVRGNFSYGTDTLDTLARLPIRHIKIRFVNRHTGRVTAEVRTDDYGNYAAWLPSGGDYTMMRRIRGT